MAQEKLSHHLDDVEVSIAEQVAQKSHHFFQVRNLFVQKWENQELSKNKRTVEKYFMKEGYAVTVSKGIIIREPTMTLKNPFQGLFQL